MAGKVMWIDEDERVWATERRLLNGLGFDVEIVADATTAFQLARSRLDLYELFILDVMLLPGDDAITFSTLETYDGKHTGIVLARKLYEIDQDIGKRLLFFSRAEDAALIGLIEKTKTELGAFYLPKKPQNQGRNFIVWLLDKGFIVMTP